MGIIDGVLFGGEGSCAETAVYPSEEIPNFI
jgi:hypothetical protein